MIMLFYFILLYYIIYNDFNVILHNNCNVIMYIHFKKLIFIYHIYQYQWLTTRKVSNMKYSSMTI